MGSVDLGDPGTWPPEVREQLEDVAHLFRRQPGFSGADTYANDLSLDVQADLDLEAEVRILLARERLLMYHGTRLLPHEVNRVLSVGLRALTDELPRDKLDAARVHHPDLLATGDVDLLLASGPLFWGYAHQARRGEVCVVAPLAIVADDEGMRPLLQHWGGESLAWAAHMKNEDGTKCQRTIQALSAASAPSIVEVSIAGSELPDTTDLWRVMVGHLLGCLEPWNQWHLRKSIPADAILEIIQPGNRRWSDAWTGLVFGGAEE